MGFISSAIDGLIKGLGDGMLSLGEWMLQAGYEAWKGCSAVTVDYVLKDPSSQESAWSLVTGSIYSVSLAIAASLSILYFVIGWLRESIDIRNNFTLENMFRSFIRYILTASLLANSLNLVTGITECTTAVVSSVGANGWDGEPEGIFHGLRTSMEEDGDIGGIDWFAMGFGGMLGGLIGGLVILVCGVGLILSVLSRLFNLLLCIPFAPVAFAGFAGGQELSQTGIAWIRTYLSYALEAVVIVLAIAVSFGMFADAALFDAKDPTLVSLILKICEFCVPMVAACACVRGANLVVRRCLGLG